MLDSVSDPRRAGASDLPELRRVPHDPPAPGQRAASQLGDHEVLVRRGELAPDAFGRRGAEAEARVVFRVAEHEDDLVAEPRALPQTFAHERRADAAPLTFGEDGHRPQTHRAPDA